MDVVHSTSPPAMISMNEHDIPIVNLSIAIFHPDMNPTTHPSTPPATASSFHWALALEQLNPWASDSRYHPNVSMTSVDSGSNSASSSSDEDTDMPFKPFLPPSPPSPSSSPSPSPPPRSSSDPRLHTVPVNLYHILNTRGAQWETCHQTDLRLDSIPSYLGSVDVARIGGVDMKDLDEFLMQFTAENPRPGAKWNAATWAIHCLEDLHLSELISLPTPDRDALYRHIMSRINVLSASQKQRKGSKQGHLSSGSPTSTTRTRTTTTLLRVSL